MQSAERSDADADREGVAVGGADAGDLHETGFDLTLHAPESLWRRELLPFLSDAGSAHARPHGTGTACRVALHIVLQSEQHKGGLCLRCE